MLAWALAGVAAANALVGARIEPLLRDSPVGELFELEARIARFPARERVQVLVFGNSHTLYALRPPSLGPALGLAPDQVFNLSLPGTNAFETGLHARRLAARFPNARRALVAADEVTLTLVPWYNDARIRYLTRFDPAARLRYAGYLPDVDRRVAALAWQPFPLADFAAALRGGARQAPGLLATRLVMGEVGREPTGLGARTSAEPYRWGFPPLFDHEPGSAAWRARYARSCAHDALAGRAGLFFGVPEAIGRSLEDLEATCRTLEGRGLTVGLVGALYAAPLRRLLARERPGLVRAHQAALGAWLAAGGRAYAAPDLAVPDAAFNNADHLSPAGARLYADAVVRELGWTPMAGAANIR